MPDQSSAADEHALMQEITAPLTTLPDDAMPLVADVDFAIVLRGYDRVAVDAYVKKTSQLVAELQSTRSPEAAVRRALERVGEQVSEILKRAHQTAAEITAQSRRDAEDRLEVARREAAGIVSGAESRVKELDGDTDRIWVERQRIVDDVRGLSEELLALAQAAGQRFPPGDDAQAPPLPGEEPGAQPLPGEEPGAELLPGEADAVGDLHAYDPGQEPAGDVEPPLEATPEPEPEHATDPHDPTDPEHATDPHDEGQHVSDTEATAVLPTIRELEVDPPPEPSFGDEREHDK